jgi:hypothetical protein
MGVLKSGTYSRPGSFGISTQDDVAADESLRRFSGEATNFVIDSTGKLCSREDFALQTAGFSGTLQTLYTHRLNTGAETILSAGGGVVYSGIGALTSRFDYRAGSQIVDVGGAKTAATATGLANGATVYTYTISVDGGGTQTISIIGSAAQTYADLITQINADITGATVALVGGNLKFTSATTGAASSIALTAGGGGSNLLTTLTSFVAVRTATAGTASNDNWQFASLSSKIFLAQKNQAFTCLNESTYAVESIVGQPWTTAPNVVIAAAGRLWAADDEAGSNRHTVWWSNLLDGKTWNSGDAGSLNVQNVWPDGQDSIVALVFMSGRLLILGRNSILLYTLPADMDPATMELTDVIRGLGCRARDSVVVAGGDVYFLADDGVYKIPKLAQSISLLNVPVKISKMIADDVLTAYSAETMSSVRAGYYPKEKWYVLNAPVTNKVFCWHLDRVLAEPLLVPAVTTWTNTSVPFRGFCYDKDGNWYTAMASGVGKYSGYTPDGAGNAYSIGWYTLWDHFDDETRLKHLKNWAMTLEAASGQTGVFRWQTDYLTGVTNTSNFTCSATEFAENPGLGIVSGQLGRSCNSVRFGCTAVVNGSKITLHALRAYAQPGKVKIR